MSDIDWSIAPEGATHCDSLSGEFYKPVNKGFLWNGVSWVQTVNDFNWTVSRERVVSRPSSHEWDGESVPHIGARIEAVLNEGAYDYRPCVVVGHYEGTPIVVFDDDGGSILQWGEDVRKLRTPEEIEKEERERIVRQMMEDSKERLSKTCSSIIGRTQAESLYLKGWRKTGEGK